MGDARKVMCVSGGGATSTLLIYCQGSDLCGEWGAGGEKWGGVERGVLDLIDRMAVLLSHHLVY